MKQRDAVLAYLLEHGSITSLEAIQLGCTRLAHLIWKFRKEGMDIKTEAVEVPTRYGTARIARYTI